MSIESNHPSSGVRTRFETEDDIPAIRRVNKEAFKRDLESRIVDALRSAGTVIMSMVAVVDADEIEIGESSQEEATISTWGGEGGGWGDVPGYGEPGTCGSYGSGGGRVVGGTVIGHALVTPVRVFSERGDNSLLGLGPVAVLPENQGQGAGTLLIEACLEQAREAGHPGIVVVGDPRYYSRFGFIPASRWGLRWEIDTPEDSFMALELCPGQLNGIAGVVRYRPEFMQSTDL